MKKLTISSAALLSLGLVASSAQAADYSMTYFQANPEKSSYVIQLSGDCKGKITLPVTEVSYGREYSNDNAPGQVDKDSFNAWFNIRTSDPGIYVSVSNYAESAGEKITESVKKNKYALSFNVIGSGYWGVASNFDTLAGGTYDAQITCKDGGTLQQQMMPGWNPYFDARGEKVSGSLTHTNDTSNPSVGTYKVKLTSTGTIQVPSQCALKGELASADYSLVCTPAKKITIKTTASAQGTSVPDWASAQGTSVPD